METLSFFGDLPKTNKKTINIYLSKFKKLNVKGEERL
jgi:hypothetical protein